MISGPPFGERQRADTTSSRRPPRGEPRQLSSGSPGRRRRTTVHALQPMVVYGGADGLTGAVADLGPRRVEGVGVGEPEGDEAGDADGVGDTLAPREYGEDELVGRIEVLRLDRLARQELVDLGPGRVEVLVEV